MALQYSRDLLLPDDEEGASDDAAPPPPLVLPPSQTWVLDTVPGRADPSVRGVLRAISSVNLADVESRSHLIEILTTDEERGGVADGGVAAWIATNLRGKEGEFEWTFDLDVANELVDNFRGQDLVRTIGDVTTAAARGVDAARPTRGTDVHLVVAGRNGSWTEDAIAELRGIPSYREPTSSSPSTSPPPPPPPSPSAFRMHRLEKAGHWVHVDDVEGLMDLMVEGLRDVVRGV